MPRKKGGSKQAKKSRKRVAGPKMKKGGTAGRGRAVARKISTSSKSSINKVPRTRARGAARKRVDDYLASKGKKITRQPKNYPTR